jgi:hypothetical protein
MARKRLRVWSPATPRPVAPNTTEKQTIVTACEAFIANVLKPRFLPEIKPTQFNYPVDIRGDWRAGRYRFIQRYRSGHADNPGVEFDAPFIRLDHMGPDRFDIYWMRHTGTWWPVFNALTLAEALHTIEKEHFLHPH